MSFFIRTFVEKRAVAALLLLFAIAAAASAQTAPATLTLDEAIGLARRNNPTYLTDLTRSVSADWAVRESYGALLPGASLSSSLSWQQAGTQRFGIFTGSDLGLATSTDYYSSSYSVNLSYRLSGSSLLAPNREKTVRRATEADIDAAGTRLEQSVTQSYLAVLRARDGVVLARQELQRAEENLKLAQARVAVGSAIPLDARQAEVERGRAQVQLLQAENDVQIQRVRLAEVLGVRLEPTIELTTAFTVGDVPWDLETLLAAALESHPQVRAARATLAANNTTVRMARSAYLPSLSLNAGFSGFTRQAGNEEFLIAQAQGQLAGQRESCQLFNAISAGLSNPLPNRPADCASYVLTPDAEARLRSSNQVFPFNFSREPWSLSLTLSLPVFEGFGRERQIEEARVQVKSAEYRVRAQELSLRTLVETGYLNVATMRQTVDLEARNQTLAEDQLRLARERYRIGSAAFLELQDAETIKARADRAYLDAVYNFHASLADLQAAVGRPLRETGNR
jgi:outer membrane protein